ncbi:MAG: DNA mismatch repair endonuclease MutL, partial [Dehalococcoidales bacterium]|nr:DNA mismatch repair endonuclease MutL [Dehalococcoidales bacterium]
LKNGEVVSRGSQGRSPGTTITVRNLFRQIPARLKFLKSPATENSHIADVVSQYALAFPEVKFSLTIDGRVVLRTPGSGQLIDAIAEVHGLEIARNMLPVDSSGEWQSGTELGVTVSGLVGTPAISRASREYLSFFVNRRWVNSRLLAWAVEEAYHGLLMQGKHPVAVINIALPYPEVDVNIHPAKTEIKFQNERLVFRVVQKAVRQALLRLTPVPKIEEVTMPRAPTLSLPEEPAASSSPGRSPDYHPASPLAPSEPLPLLRVLGQLMSSYIIAEGPDGLYLIDQHAAHERILFEKVRDQRLKREVEVQGLLEPVTLTVSLRQEAVLKTGGADLTELGFSIEPFGDRTYLVRAVPVLLYQKDWAGMVRELLDSFSGQDRKDWQEAAVVLLACHSAVRAGQPLSGEEMYALIRQLERTELPRTCPHGRPTMVHLSLTQLRLEFGRI